MLIKPSLEVKYQLGPLNYAITSIAFNPRKNQILTTDGHTLRMWSLRGEIKRVSVPKTASISCLQYSQAEDVWFAVYGGLEVRLYSAELEVLQEFAAHQRPILCSAFHQSRQELVTGGVDGVLKVWSCGRRKTWTEGRLLTQLKCTVRLAVQYDKRWLTSLHLEEKAERIFAACESDVLVWHHVTGELLYKLSGLHALSITSLAYVDESKYLITASSDRSVKVWDFQNGRITPLDSLNGHTRKVNSVLWEPDTGTLLTSSDDGTIRSWDVDKGEELLALQLSPSAPAALALSLTSAHATALAGGGKLKARSGPGGREGGGNAPPSADGAPVASSHIPALPGQMMLARDVDRQARVVRRLLLCASGPIITVMELNDELLTFAQCSDTVVSVQVAPIIERPLSQPSQRGAGRGSRRERAGFGIEPPPGPSPAPTTEPGGPAAPSPAPHAEPPAEAAGPAGAGEEEGGPVEGGRRVLHEGVVVLGEDNTVQVLDTRWGHVSTIITPSGKKESRTTRAYVPSAEIPRTPGTPPRSPTNGAANNRMAVYQHYVPGQKERQRAPSPTGSPSKRSAAERERAGDIMERKIRGSSEIMVCAYDGVDDVLVLAWSNGTIDRLDFRAASRTGQPRPDFPDGPTRVLEERDLAAPVLCLSIVHERGPPAPAAPAGRPAPPARTGNNAPAPAALESARRIVSGASDGFVTLWAAGAGLSGLPHDWGRLRTWRAHWSKVIAVGHLTRPFDAVVSAAGDGQIKVVDTAGFALVSQFASAGLTAALLTTERAVCGCEDGSIELWSYGLDAQELPAAPAVPLAVLRGHSSRVTHLAPGAWPGSPDGDRMLLSASEEGLVCLWDLARADPLRTVQFPQAVRRVCLLNADGDVLAALGSILQVSRASRRSRRARSVEGPAAGGRRLAVTPEAGEQSDRRHSAGDLSHSDSQLLDSLGTVIPPPPAPESALAAAAAAAAALPPLPQRSPRPNPFDPPRHMMPIPPVSVAVPRAPTPEHLLTGRAREKEQQQPTVEVAPPQRLLERRTPSPPGATGGEETARRAGSPPRSAGGSPLPASPPRPVSVDPAAEEALRAERERLVREIREGRGPLSPAVAAALSPAPPSPAPPSGSRPGSAGSAASGEGGGQGPLTGRRAAARSAALRGGIAAVDAALQARLPLAAAALGRGAPSPAAAAAAAAAPGPAPLALSLDVTATDMDPSALPGGERTGSGRSGRRREVAGGPPPLPLSSEREREVQPTLSKTKTATLLTGLGLGLGLSPEEHNRRLVEAALREAPGAGPAKRSPRPQQPPRPPRQFGVRPRPEEQPLPPEMAVRPAPRRPNRHVFEDPFFDLLEWANGPPAG